MEHEEKHDTPESHTNNSNLSSSRSRRSVLSRLGAVGLLTTATVPGLSSARKHTNGRDDPTVGPTTGITAGSAGDLSQRQPNPELAPPAGQVIQVQPDEFPIEVSQERGGSVGIQSHGEERTYEVDIWRMVGAYVTLGDYEFEVAVTVFGQPYYSFTLTPNNATYVDTQFWAGVFDYKLIWTADFNSHTLEVRGEACYWLGHWDCDTVSRLVIG